MRGTFGCFDHADGPVRVVESLVGHASDVRLGYLVDAVHRMEELTPVAIARLVGCKLGSQSFIVSQAADKIGLGASLDHLQLVVADVFFLQPIDLRVNCVGYFLGVMSGQRESVKGKQVWIFNAGQPAETSGKRRDLFVAYQRSVETRGAALGH